MPLPPVQHLEVGMLSKEREHDGGLPLSQDRGKRLSPSKTLFSSSVSESLSAEARVFWSWPDREQVKARRTVRLDATGQVAATEAEMLATFEATRIALRRVFEGGNQNECTCGS